MKAAVLVLPEWLSTSGPPLRDLTPEIQRRCETDRVVRLAPTGDSLLEAACLGLDIRAEAVAPGPLFVAAFGAEPPARSVHFCLTLCGVMNEVVLPLANLQPQELEAIKEAIPRLNTRRLTSVWGMGVHHALVWEGGSLDAGVSDLADAVGRPLRDCLPQGDGESALRRYIDDSIDLLSGLPFNARRVDLGLPAANVLWPWGPGFPPPLPNLNLLYGPMFRVESALIPLAGLTKLSSCRHGDIEVLASPNDYALDYLSEQIQRGGPAVIVLDWFSRLARQQDWERFERLSRELDPLLNTSNVLVPSTDSNGLAMLKTPSKQPTTFDQIAIDDTALPVFQLHEVVKEAILDPQATN